MKIFWTICTIVLCPSVLCGKEKPHIITILIDDLGWHDVGFQGSDQVKTPNIDALAYSGIILGRHYVLPTCSPSRTALLTGSYPIRSGMQGYPLRGGENRNVPLSFKLMPSYLKDQGYRTHLVGKWHLGYQTPDHVPHQRGFDTFFGYYNGYVDYYSYCYNQSLISQQHEKYFCGYDMHFGDDIYWTKEPIYATTLFTERAREVIQRHNESEPLYLYLSHLATHTGNEVKGSGVQIPTDMDVDQKFGHIKNRGRRNFAGCLEELDRSIGIVVEELKNKAMLDNSIILVISDNGAHTVSVDMEPNWSSNWPLRGTKFTLFEGGVRGAALIWSPFLPRGFINNNFLHISDWLPTFYAAAGGDTKNLKNIDGKSQWEALKNSKAIKRNHLLININEITQAEAIIWNDRWKLVKGGFPFYGNYDLHWGKEENVAPNPAYNFSEVIDSSVGKAIRSLKGYDDIFQPKKMEKLRDKASLKCEPNTPEVRVSENGYVPPEDDHLCPDFCVFDLLNDPCEMNKLNNEEVLKVGKRLLEEYKEKLVPQKESDIDLLSDPGRSGGVWMPWDPPTRFRSLGKHLAPSLLSLALSFVCVGYFLSSRNLFPLLH